MPERVAVYDLTYDELAGLLAGWGEPPFRVAQVWRWLYRSLVSNPEAMANLPASLRARLADEADIALLVPLAEQSSASQQTRKVLFRLRDGATIESVVMTYRERRSVCVSTQVGCGMGCVFCATGQAGLERSLSAGEIVAQVLHFARESGEGSTVKAGHQGSHGQSTGLSLTNVVLMGMGEPLANYAATWRAIETLTDARGFNLGARRITLSTVGLVPGIRHLAVVRLPINLAVSLHAPDDELRSRLVPANRRYPIAAVLEAVREHIAKTGRRVTFEYALIDGVNDAPEQAKRLASLLSGILCHVNLIALNPIADGSLRPSSREHVNNFRDALRSGGIPCTVRLRRGLDIEAGCGQLRQRQTAIASG